MRYYIHSPVKSLPQGAQKMISAFKPLARDIYGQLLYRLGFSHPSRISSDSLVILTFHRVLPRELRDQYPLPGLVVTPDELRWILASLLHHFETLAVSDAVRKHRAGSTSRPLLAISFDDGQWDNLEYAAPVLGELGVPATFYLPTDFIGSSELLWHDQAAFAWQALKTLSNSSAVIHKMGPTYDCVTASVGAFLERLKQMNPKARADLIYTATQESAFVAPSWARMMDWTEVNHLAKNGHEVGSHGCSHALLTQLDDVSQKAELEYSRSEIRCAIGRNPTAFCYPNGTFDARAVAFAEQVGYESAVTTQWGINKSGTNAYRLKRCDMDARRLLDRNNKVSLARLTMRLSGRQPGLANR